MHAHAISVSFPCVDLKNIGSPEPQTIKLKRTKVHAFSCILGDNNIETNHNQITNQRSVPKIRQRVGNKKLNIYEKVFIRNLRICLRNAIHKL